MEGGWVDGWGVVGWECKNCVCMRQGCTKITLGPRAFWARLGEKKTGEVGGGWVGGWVGAAVVCTKFKKNQKMQLTTSSCLNAATQKNALPHDQFVE